MWHLTKKADYSLWLLTALVKEKGRLVSLKTLARKYQLPYKFIGQIAGDLKRAKILKSKEGVGGGYWLAKRPEKITVAQVIEAVKERQEVAFCRECGRKKQCRNRRLVRRLERAIAGVLKQTTIAELC